MGEGKSRGIPCKIANLGVSHKFSVEKFQNNLQFTSNRVIDNTRKKLNSRNGGFIMVKVLVNGGLFEISKVEEIVEKRVPFNGTNIRLVQIAKDSKQAVSGLHFQVKNTECNVFAIGEFTIGNLPTAKVKEIMKQLLSDGYYDFSDCDFQPMMFVEKYG